jgi:protein TonB
MAKGVDLTSKEWCDLVFEGKNKEFGAYQLRKKSPKRHWVAIVGVLILLAAVAVIYAGVKKYNEIKEAEALAKGAQMSEVLFETDTNEAPEEEEEVKYEEQPEPEEQVVEEQVASQQVTAIAIVEKADADKEVKNMDQIQENEAQVGNVNQEGKIDISEVNTATKAVTVVEEKPKEEPKVEKPQPEKIFEAVEQPAEFPGGRSALAKWLSNNLRYPEVAQANNIQGRVVVKFTVEKDGSISNPTVVRGVDKDLDREAIRVVKKMPRWNAGKNNGVAVRSYFNLPVNFKLQQN